MAAAKAKQDEIDRQKSMVLYEAQAAERAKAQAEAEDNALLSEAFIKARDNPTAENRLNLVNLYAARDPAKSKAMTEAFAQYDTDTQQTILRDSSNILTAFDTSPEFGIAELEKYAQAAENSKDEGDAKQYRDMIARSKSGPEGVQAVKDFYVLTIGRLPGGDKALEGVGKVGKETRERANAPAEQRKLLAEAGLSEAKINETMANTRKLDAETQRLLLEAIAKKKSGGLSEKEIKDTTLQLNNTVYSRTAGARTAQTSYDNIKAGAASSDGVGDLAVINTFMRLLSPGIVTEQDYTSATKSGGLLDELKTLGAKVEKGQLLSPGQRDRFVGLSKTFMENAQKQSDIELKSIRKIVDELGIPVDQVFNTQGTETTGVIGQTPGASPTAKVVGAPAGVGKAVTGGGPVQIDEAGFRAYIEANSPAADRAEARGIKDFNELQRVFSKSARAYAATLAPKKPTEEADF
jgi:hypothetical protein